MVGGAGFCESPVFLRYNPGARRTMTLVGTRVGSYDMIALLGVGGMGEVYRAHDIRLGRDVAIKILPVSLARNPDRLGRFEREARVLASLNHLHIGAIYGVEETGGTTAISGSPGRTGPACARLRSRGIRRRRSASRSGRQQAI